MFAFTALPFFRVVKIAPGSCALAEAPATNSKANNITPLVTCLLLIMFISIAEFNAVLGLDRSHLYCTGLVRRIAGNRQRSSNSPPSPRESGYYRYTLRNSSALCGIRLRFTPDHASPQTTRNRLRTSRTILPLITI